MIFATVGSQEPFDRLIRAVDEWARARGRSDVFAQIGNSTIRPRHIEFTNFLEPADFNRVIREATIIVAHAGMGSIISALEIGKPIVVMPRRGNSAKPGMTTRSPPRNDLAPTVRSSWPRTKTTSRRSLITPSRFREKIRLPRRQRRG